MSGGNGMGGMMNSGVGNNNNMNMNMGNNMLPSVSNLSGYNSYDGSGGSLLMGGMSGMGGIEASPLFLAPGVGGGGGANKLGGDSLLPPLPKKRTDITPATGAELPPFPTGGAGMVSTGGVVNAASTAMNKKPKTN